MFDDFKDLEWTDSHGRWSGEGRFRRDAEGYAMAISSNGGSHESSRLSKWSAVRCLTLIPEPDDDWPSRPCQTVISRAPCEMQELLREMRALSMVRIKLARKRKENNCMLTSEQECHA